MEYITYNTLVNDIRSNFYKIPKDIYGVIGIPRSGMLPASIIAGQINVGLTTIGNFVEKKNNGCGLDVIFGEHGNRKLKNTNGEKVKILVVDDTCYNGRELLKNKQKLKAYTDIDFIFMVVYMEGSGTLAKPDIYLRDVTSLAQKSEINIVLYEWNIFSNPNIVDKTIYDLDGVMCVEPPDERNIKAYIKYLENPIPLYIPTTDKEITILTYRLNKYRKLTESFLIKNGLNSLKLFMFNSDSYEERGKIPPWLYKGNFYKANDYYKLFVESDDFQARKICEISGKPVYCVDTNKMYNVS